MKPPVPQFSEIAKSRIVERITNTKAYGSLAQLLQKYGLYRPETAIVVAAVCIGAVGSMLQHAQQSAFEREIKENYQVIPVLGASSRLEAGTILRKEHFTYINMLAGVKTKNMLTEDDVNAVVGRPLQVPIGQGDVLMLTMVNSSNMNESISSKIPAGKRLYTMIISDPVAQSGFVRPGDFVDVISTMDFPGKGSTTFYLMSAVQLTAVDKSLDPKSGVPASQISFMVSPQQMELLKYAEGKGMFSISLRNPEDRDAVKTGKGINEDTFLSSELVYSSADQPVKVIENGSKPKK
jgi:pilus assembly protein CpaB